MKQNLNDVTTEKKASEDRLRVLEGDLTEINIKLQTRQNELNSCEENLKDCSRIVTEKNERIMRISLQLKNCEKQMLHFKEQVRKLSVCHGELFYRISPSINIREISPKEYSCSAVDASEKEGWTEVLLARFKMVEDGGAFKAEFEED